MHTVRYRTSNSQKFRKLAFLKGNRYKDNTYVYRNVILVVFVFVLLRISTRIRSTVPTEVRFDVFYIRTDISCQQLFEIAYSQRDVVSNYLFRSYNK